MECECFTDLNHCRVPIEIEIIKPKPSVTFHTTKLAIRSLGDGKVLRKLLCMAFFSSLFLRLNMMGLRKGVKTV